MKEAKKFDEAKMVLTRLLHFMKPYKTDGKQLFICHANRQTFFNEEKNEYNWGMIDYHFMEHGYRAQGLQYSFWKMFDLDYCLSTIWLAKQLGYGEQQARDENGQLLFTKSGRPKKEGNGLAIWAKRIGFNLDHHTAESDTLCCVRVREHLTLNHGLET